MLDSLHQLGRSDRNLSARFPALEAIDVHERSASERRVAEAIGTTEAFLALLEEYEKAPDITRTRLYLEAMEKILPDWGAANKVEIDLDFITSIGNKLLLTAQAESRAA